MVMTLEGLRDKLNNVRTGTHGIDARVSDSFLHECISAIDALLSAQAKVRVTDQMVMLLRRLLIDAGYEVIEWEDARSALEACFGSPSQGAQCEALPEFLKDPVNVHTLMLRGNIAVPSIRDMVDLRGEVPNGEDAQLARIAELQEQLSERAAVPDDVLVQLRACSAEHREIANHYNTKGYLNQNNVVEKHVTSYLAIDKAIAALTIAPQPHEGAQIISGDMVTVNRSNLLKLLEHNLNASSEAISATSGIDFIEAHGGPDADDCIERVAYHLYYGLFAAERLREQLAGEVQP